MPQYSACEARAHSYSSSPIAPVTCRNWSLKTIRYKNVGLLLLEMHRGLWTHGHNFGLSTSLQADSCKKRCSRSKIKSSDYELSTSKSTTHSMLESNDQTGKEHV